MAECDTPTHATAAVPLLLLPRTQISCRLLSARSANALLELPRAAGELPAGTAVSALLIDDLCGTMPQECGEVPATPGFGL
jgi:gephyrin